MNNNYVAIMAGGIGSRFWPGSRQTMPKQFLDILGVGKSLIQLTYERFLNICPKENIFIVTNKLYKDLVKEHLPDLTDNQILCEPSRNNTAPCVAYTAFKLESLNPDANMVVAPSDHIILKEAEFVRIVNKALSFADQNDALLTLGIQPTKPHTGYGYIQYGSSPSPEIHEVVRFTEKPPLEKAQAFLTSGDYLWNAGIFIWKASKVLEAYKEYATEIHEILGKGKGVYNTSNEQEFIDRVYPTTPNISVDYAIMENARNIYTIPSDFGWSDLGSWGALYDETDKDAHGNVVNADRIILEEVTNCFVRAPKDKLVVLRGMDDFIVIDEGDVLVVYPKPKEQEIKKVRGVVKEQFGANFV